VTPNDAGKFAQILSRTLKPYPFADTTADNIEMWFEGFKKFPLEVIAAALNRHVFDPVKGGKSPMPSDIMASLVGRSGQWLSPDEAWARAALAHDDRNTVVMCDEIRDALATVQHLIDGGDTFNAPRAFKDAYARNVEQSRMKQAAPRWYVSAGYDKQQRLQVTQKAVEDGFIALADGRAAVPMLAGPGEDRRDDPEAVDNRARAMEALAGLDSKWEENQRREAAEAAERTAKQKEAHKRRVDEFKESNEGETE